MGIIDLISNIIVLPSVEWINIMPLYSILSRTIKKWRLKINCKLIRLYSES